MNQKVFIEEVTCLRLGVGQAGEGVLEHSRQKKSKKLKAWRQEIVTLSPHKHTGETGAQHAEEIGVHLQPLLPEK